MMFILIHLSSLGISMWSVPDLSKAILSILKTAKNDSEVNITLSFRDLNCFSLLGLEIVMSRYCNVFN